MGEKQKVRDRSKTEYDKYYMLAKDFADPQGADNLIRIHTVLAKRSDSYGHLFTAASAAAESGLLADHHPRSERHRRIDLAKTTWQKAQDAYLYKHMHQNWTEGRMMCVPDKVQMQLMYSDIYHEMVEGYIEESTLGKLHANLVRTAALNKQLHDTAEAAEDWSTAVQRRGIGYELGTILTVTRLGSPSLFAVPSTARSDHGGFMPRNTHDVRVIQQSHGNINWWVPIEVKPTETHSERYEAAFVRGRVELLMPSSIQPLELADFMLAELEGHISEKHYSELNDITSRVLGLVKDYRARDEFKHLSLQTA